MKFAEKLDFLMTLTKTTNNALAHNLMFDASFISRLRTGRRLMPKNEEVIRRMAAYLAERLTDNTSKKIVMDVIEAIPSDSLASTISLWLTRDDEQADEGTNGQVGRFLNNLSGFTPKAPPGADVPSGLISTTDELMSIHYGVEGKRMAVQFFLSEVALRDKPQTLLLHSSEEMSWMTGDPAFSQKWSALMFAILSKGNRIKIIHTVDRGIDEMLDSIASWMPVYITGLIEPYYYPKKRDNTFKQTMFIAPETSAVISHSINDETGNAANILFRDKSAIAAYVAEFNGYLSMCRPLFKIFIGNNITTFMDALTEFEMGDANTIEKRFSLSALTMPKKLLVKFLKDAGDETQRLLDIHDARMSRFKKLLKTKRYTDIISLPDVRELANGEVKSAMSVLMEGRFGSYTPQDYIEHLNNIIALLKANDNYHIHITGKPLDEQYILYCREDLGVIVAKTSEPPIGFAANESQLTAAFWDFLKHSIGSQEYDHPDNEKAILKLREYIEEIKGSLKAKTRKKTSG